MSDDLPFTRAEWSLILDALNGAFFMEEIDGQEGFSARSTIITEVYDHIRLNAADRKWGVDEEALMGRLIELDDEGHQIIKATAEGFWALSEDVRASRVPGKD